MEFVGHIWTSWVEHRLTATTVASTGGPVASVATPIQWINPEQAVHIPDTSYTLEMTHREWGSTSACSPPHPPTYPPSLPPQLASEHLPGGRNNLHKGDACLELLCVNPMLGLTELWCSLYISLSRLGLC